MHDYSGGSQYENLYLHLLNALSYVSATLVLFAIIWLIYLFAWMFVRKNFLDPLADRAVNAIKGSKDENIKQ